MHIMNTLTVNGKEQPLSPGTTVSALLSTVYSETGSVVVEVNGDIIPTEQFDTMPLNPGDMVEIVHFVGGGD